jgi:uncharacterized phage protein (TIGR02220 family)
MLNGLLELLRSDGSIIINKALAKKIGLHEAIVYSELISKYIYYRNKNMLFTFDDLDGEWFYSTEEDLFDSTTLGKSGQKRAINNIKNIGLIKQENKKPRGFDSQVRFFQITNDVNLILSLLDDKKEESNKKTLESYEESRKERNQTFESTSEKNEIEFSKGMNRALNNTNINNTNKINKEYIVGQPDNAQIDNLIIDDKSKKKKDNTALIEEVITYLNEKTDKQFKSTTSKYITLINKWVKEGYTLEDFKKVIDIKCTWWLDDADNNKWLRPSTLFGNKFDEYLNEQPKTEDANNKIIHTKFKKDEPWKNFDQRKYTDEYWRYMENKRFMTEDERKEVEAELRIKKML